MLGTYSANNQDIRAEIEKALQKLNKAECVKEVYHAILNAMDAEELDENEDILWSKDTTSSKQEIRQLKSFPKNGLSQKMNYILLPFNT